MATCPECDAEIEVDEFDVDKGDLISCPECGSNLEVTGTSPVELDLADEDDDEEEADDREDGAPNEVGTMRHYPLFGAVRPSCRRTRRP